MFIKKDTRKIHEIIDAGEEDDLQHLKLARRRLEFKNGEANALFRPRHAERLEQVARLNLYANELKSLKGIRLMVSLTELNLGCNFLKELPAELAQLKPSLRVLWLDDNQLETFPAAILELTNLTALRLSSNKLRSIPPQVRMLRALEELVVDHNALGSLPETLGDLAGLRLLNVRQNHLTALPNTLGTLSKLKTLAASSNEIAALPSGMENLSSLEGLFLNGNKLTSFPVACLGLKELNTLNVGCNAIAAALPAEVTAAWGNVDTKGIRLTSKEVEVTVRGNPFVKLAAASSP